VLLLGLTNPLILSFVLLKPINTKEPLQPINIQIPPLLVQMNKLHIDHLFNNFGLDHLFILFWVLIATIYIRDLLGVCIGGEVGVGWGLGLEAGAFLL
jgi:hypothetical protein